MYTATFVRGRWSGSAMAMLRCRLIGLVEPSLKDQIKN